MNKVRDLARYLDMLLNNSSGSTVMMCFDNDGNLLPKTVNNGTWHHIAEAIYVNYILDDDKYCQYVITRLDNLGYDVIVEMVRKFKKHIESINNLHVAPNAQLVEEEEEEENQTKEPVATVILTKQELEILDKALYSHIF